jgi:hypothetical protein
MLTSGRCSTLTVPLGSIILRAAPVFRTRRRWNQFA